MNMFLEESEDEESGAEEWSEETVEVDEGEPPYEELKAYLRNETRR